MSNSGAFSTCCLSVHPCPEISTKALSNKLPNWQKSRKNVCFMDGISDNDIVRAYTKISKQGTSPLLG
jgi:hypothetical protein